MAGPRRIGGLPAAATRHRSRHPDELADRHDGRPDRARDDIDILRPQDVRRLPERQALVIAENGRPIIARLHRSIDGRTGRAFLADQQRLRQQLTGRPAERSLPADLAGIALDEARVRGLIADRREGNR